MTMNTIYCSLDIAKLFLKELNATFKNCDQLKSSQLCWICCRTFRNYAPTSFCFSSFCPTRAWQINYVWWI